MSTTDYNVTVGIETDPETFDLNPFAEWSAVLGAAPQGGQQLVLTIPAQGLRQAIGTALSIVEAAGLTPQAVDALTTVDYDYRSAVAATDTVGLPEAAEILGVTREAVRQRAASGSLPATKNGRDWRISRALVEREARSKSARQVTTA